jgi:hypothetical protein
LGTLVASASVTSPHTIHKGITRSGLRELAAGLAPPPGPALAALLAG